jgi:hypothetical protein
VRKVTGFRGKNIRTKFLKAEVTDWQVAGAGRDAADYWIATFLEGQLFLSSQKGSELLSRGLKVAVDAAKTDDDRDLVFAATVLASQGRVTTCSLATFADRLPATVRDSFLAVADPEVAELEFAIDKEVVRHLAGRRTLEGTDGVKVSAPQRAIGRSVVVETRGDGARVVRYEGVVAKEQVERDDKRR